MIGRRTEQRLLRELADGGRPEFVVVYGRRRVGKTHLVRETFEGRFTFSYTGSAHVSGRVQLAQFARALRDYGHDSNEPIADWFGAFGALRTLVENEPPDQPAIVFLDELPWMDRHKSLFLPALESFWNGWGSGRKNLTLIACGSATAWIVNKVFRNKGGLYNRVTNQLLLQPFTLGEAHQLLVDNGVVWGFHDVVEAYMIFGGIPYYLNLMKRGLSLALNVDAVCFAEGGRLAHEFPGLFDTLFSSPERHLDVVRALARKRAGLSRDDIAKAVSFPDGGNLTRVLRELEESGFLRRYRPYGKKKKKGALFQLSDPFTAFYLEFMDEGHGPDFWSTFTDNARHRAWSGYAFESLCLAHVPQLRRALGIGSVLTDVSSWRSAQGVQPGAQIDLVLDRNDNVINLCEMKYAGGLFAVDAALERAVRDRTEIFRSQTGTPKALHPTLVTTFGLSPGQHADVFQSVVTAEDLARDQ
jgi:hypothetical protein